MLSTSSQLVGVISILIFSTLVSGCGIQTGSLIVYTTPSSVVDSGVGGNCFGGSGPPHTSCRSNSANFVSFGTLDAATIVTVHNAARASVSPSAKQMDNLVWNSILAFLAQRWSAQCGNNSERYIDRSVPGVWDYVGQNIYVDTSTTAVDFSKAFAQWTNQKATGPFTYGDTGMTNDRVGYYTQIIWAETDAVGCAAAICSSPSAVYYVCNYGPGGNYHTDGRHPFAYPYTALYT